VPRRRTVCAPGELLTQALQSRGEILRAGALILAFRNESAREMDETHGGLGLVAVLPAGPARAMHLHVALGKQRAIVG
jgi:hypothetical protein